MIDYRKYIQVLEILKRTNDIPQSTICKTPEETPEQKASAICDLFDEQSYENIEVDMTTGTFQSC